MPELGGFRRKCVERSLLPRNDSWFWETSSREISVALVLIPAHAMEFRQNPGSCLGAEFRPDLP